MAANKTTNNSTNRVYVIIKKFWFKKYLNKVNC